MSYADLIQQFKITKQEILILLSSYAEPGNIRHPALLFPNVAHPEHPVIVRVFHVPPVKPFVHLNPCEPLPRVQAIHTLHTPPDLWASMGCIKEVPLASSAREPRVVKRRRVRPNGRVHRRRPALTLAAHTSPRSEERKFKLDDLNAVAIRDDLHERRPVDATAHAGCDMAGGMVPPNAAEGRGPRERNGEGRGMDVRLPAAGHEHDRARKRRPVLGERASRHLEAAQRQPRAFVVVPEPERVERLERSPERGALLRDRQRRWLHPVVVHLYFVHRRVGDPDQPCFFFEDDEQAQL